MMSENRDERLESMLRSRRIQAANPDLAEKIIRRAHQIPQIQNISLWLAVRGICAEFHLPKPAYVLAGALALGIVVGLNTPGAGPTAQDAGAATTQGFFIADEGLL